MTDYDCEVQGVLPRWLILDEGRLGLRLLKKESTHIIEIQSRLSNEIYVPHRAKQSSAVRICRVKASFRAARFKASFRAGQSWMKDALVSDLTKVREFPIIRSCGQASPHGIHVNIRRHFEQCIFTWNVRVLISALEDVAGVMVTKIVPLGIRRFQGHHHPGKVAPGLLHDNCMEVVWH